MNRKKIIICSLFIFVCIFTYLVALYPRFDIDKQLQNIDYKTLIVQINQAAEKGEYFFLAGYCLDRSDNEGDRFINHIVSGCWLRRRLFRDPSH